MEIMISLKEGHGGQVKYYPKADELIRNVILKDPKKLSWQVDTEGTFGLLKSKGYGEIYFSKQLIV